MRFSFIYLILVSFCINNSICESSKEKIDKDTEKKSEKETAEADVLDKVKVAMVKKMEKMIKADGTNNNEKEHSTANEKNSSETKFPKDNENPEPLPDEFIPALNEFSTPKKKNIDGNRRLQDVTNSTEEDPFPNYSETELDEFPLLALVDKSKPNKPVKVEEIEDTQRKMRFRF